jgi:hypothetical protein
MTQPIPVCRVIVFVVYFNNCLSPSHAGMKFQRELLFNIHSRETLKVQLEVDVCVREQSHWESFEMMMMSKHADKRRNEGNCHVTKTWLGNLRSSRHDVE